jgi:histidine phosphotransferase ChpT
LAEGTAAMTDQPDLAALIGSRICHDLISPIGAIGNGVELMLLEQRHAGPEVALIAESVANANARIRFFRVAYGRAGPDQRIARSEILSILGDWTQGARLTVDWIGPVEMSRAEARLLFLIVMCLDQAMAFGGRIRVASTETGWSVLGEAAKLRPLDRLWPVLTGAADAPADLAPSEVQFALARQAALSLNRPLRLDRDDQRIRVEI